MADVEIMDAPGDDVQVENDLSLNPNVWVEEFLYRGRPPGWPQAHGWHIVLGEVVVDALGKKSYRLYEAMNPTQAKKVGFDIPSLVDGMNRQSLYTIDLLNKQITQLERQLHDATELNKALIAENEALIAVNAELKVPADG